MHLTREELAREAGEIELVTLKKLNTIFAGSRASDRIGRGLEFEEFRDYIPGQDDVSRIDWLASRKIPGRTLYQEMIEEKEMNIVLIVDTSTSMRYAQKFDLLLRIIATIGASALKMDDRIGLISFSEHVDQVVEPNTGRQHWMDILMNRLWDIESKPATHFLPALEQFENLSLGTSMVFLISDFPDELLGNRLGLYCQQLQADHDLIPIYLYSKNEFDLAPNRRVVFRMQDLETGEGTLLHNTKHNQEALRRCRELEIAKKQDYFLKLGFSCVAVNEDDYLDCLINTFATRRTPR